MSVKDRRMDRHNRETTVNLESHELYTGSHRPASLVAPPIDDWSTFTDGDTTPDISESSYWKTGSTSAVTITNFDDPKDNIHKITILFTDINTTIQHNANIVIQTDEDFTGEVDDVKVFLWDGTNWVEQAVAAPASLVGTDYFLHDSDASDISGYQRLRKTPADQSETTHVTSVSASDGDVAIEEFVTDEGDPDVLSILAGIWEFHVHASVSSTAGTTNLKIELYRRTTGGVETLIFSTEQEITSTSPVELKWSHTQTTDTTMDLTDRLVAKLLCNATSVPSRAVTTFYEGSERAAHIHAPVDLGVTAGAAGDHGELTGLTDDDHAQYLLTFIGADIGDVPYVNATGRLDLLAAELGNGFLVLNSRGPGLPPVWLDVEALIQLVTGGENVLIVKLFNIVLAAIAGATAVDSTGAAVAESDAFAVILAAFADTTAVDSTGAAASESNGFTPALPSFGFSTQVL